MTLLQRLFSILTLLTLAACGGGGGSAGTSTFGSGSGTGTGGGTTTTTPSAAGLVFTLSASSIANSGSQTVVATALAVDGNNNTVAGVPVTISVDNNGVVTPSAKVTDATGAVNGTIGVGADHTNRTLNVTATSGTITKTLQLPVVDSAGGSGTTPSDLLLVLTSTTIANDGSQTVTANVTALDAKRNVMPGVVVSFSVDQGATIAPSGTSTGTNGVISAVIGVGGLSTNRTITVTASGGGLTRTTPLQVVNSTVAPAPAAADLSLSLSSSTVDNSGSKTITATATAVDGNRNALAGIPVTFSVNSNAVATVSGTTTNSSGVVTATIGIGADRSDRVVNVTATSGTITRSASFSVYGAVLSASLSPVVNVSSTNNLIQYKLLDTNGQPMPSQSISVTSTGLPTTSGTTDGNGAFQYSYTAPGTASSLSIQATAAGSSLNSSVSVVSVGGVPNATSTPQSASLTPSPSVVSVNTVGSSTNQVQLRALFVGANNQPVPNIRVRFDLNGNANSTDGTIAFVGTYAYSDATGVASGTFTPGQISSPTNGVTVRACWDLVDFPTTTCPNSVTSTLTVASEALSVAIRTDNTVGAGTANLTYIKQFVVMVVDAAGQAKPGVLITPSVDLPSYYKGIYVWNGTLWVQQPSLANTESYSYNTAIPAWQQGSTTTQPSCPNEDVNRNGIREAPAYSATATAPPLSGRQEDLNWNGDLDPRKADVAIKMVGSATTDASGLAIVQIEYGKNLASWVDFVITVTASGISGTEAKARYSGLLYGIGNLPYPAADVSSQTVAPAFVVSPYGKGTVCTDTK